MTELTSRPAVAFANNAGGATLVAAADVELIVRAHGFADLEDAIAQHLTALCLVCQSVVVSPDFLTRMTAHNELDLTCCAPESSLNI